MKKPYIVVLSGLCLILIFVLGSFLYENLQSKKLSFLAREDASTFVREHSPTLGEDDARVYLVEFLDPACETCRKFHPYIKNLMAANPGKIKHVIRYAPFHAGADYFVKILEAAKKQGKYWETLDVMFESQPFWANHNDPRPEVIWTHLPRVGLDIDKIRKDMYDPGIAKLIEQDLADAKTLNVRRTPGYFVNGKPLRTFGYAQLKKLVEAEIDEMY